MELRKARKHQRSLPATGHNSLMLACQQEAKEDVRNILDRQPGVALQHDPTGKYALHYCAENTNVECASRILSAHPTLLNASDDEGYTPLHLAVISGNKTMVKYLLTRGADPCAVDSEKHSCVHWATVSGDCDCLDLLISSGADPSTPDIHGAFPVHYAAQMCGPNSEMGNNVRVGLAVLRTLLSKGVNVACVDRDGRPPLLWAASGETRASKTYCPSGSSDAILALVKAGADVNASDRDGLTALHCAASRGHVDCLETLVSLCGAEVDKTDEGGCSALFYAATLGHADCTNLLLNYGSQPDRQDNKSRTPAHCGAAKGQMETLKILAHHKANLWLRNAKGDMPLHEAVQSGRKDLVEWLLKRHRASVNVSNANGRTPLHIAAITNNVDMCKVLMDYGAFINPIMRNSKGLHMTPMDAALHRGNRSCAKYLSLHGALPASKLVEKREYNRFTETHLSETLELSPNRRLHRDTSAQTEPRSRDADVQAQVDLKTVAAATSDLDLRGSPPKAKAPCGTTKIRCPAEDGTGKPIIAKVYVHTKRSRMRRLTRKPTAYRRDCQGEKLLSRQHQRPDDNVQSRAYGASNNVVDAATPLQTDQSKEIPIRKASQPVLFEEAPSEASEWTFAEQQRRISEEQQLISEEEQNRMSEEQLRRLSEEQERISEEQGRISEDQIRKMSEEQLSRMSEEQLSRMSEEQLSRMSEEQLRRMSEDQLRRMSEERLGRMSEQQLRRMSEQQLRRMSEEQLRRMLEDLQGRMSEEQLRRMWEELQVMVAEEQLSMSEEQLSMSEEQLMMSEEQLRRMSEDQLRRMSEEQLRRMSEEQLRSMSEEQLRRMSEEQLRKVLEEQQEMMSEEQLRRMSEAQIRMSEEELRWMSEEHLRVSEGHLRRMSEEQLRIMSEEQLRRMSEEQLRMSEEQLRISEEQLRRMSEEQLRMSEEQLRISEEQLRRMSEEQHGRTPEEQQRKMSEGQVFKSQSPIRASENLSQICECYETHEADASTCNCNCHESLERNQLLSVDKRRRSSLLTSYDTENQSPLSSIRSIESTIKDSGFSDDLERGHRHISSSDEGDDFSDTENNRVRRKRRHVARYIVSSGAAETFRLEEDDGEEERKVLVKPRSSSLPHLKKRDERFETCPRLLNRPTITKEVQRSLKKYQMERRLFYELQELKRKQITTLPGEEREAVTKILGRFRNYVLGPTMTDFQGPYTFTSFEKYLYEQLRKLSTGGRIPKPKAGTKDRVYATPMPPNNLNEPRVLCTCKTHKCHHRLQKSDSDLALNKVNNTHIPLLPEIIQKNPMSREQQSRIPINRSKSWDRLEDNPRKNSTFVKQLSSIHTSNSLPSLSNPFPRRVPAALLAAISEKLGPDVHPDDTVVIEMSSDNNSKMRHAFTVQELQEVVTRYEEQAGRKVKPIPLETVIDPDDDEPITFEIRHGREKNVFRLPAAKLKDNKKWFLHYCLWPVGRYMLSLDEEYHLMPEDIQWQEIQLSPRTVLMLPPNFWT